MARRGKTKTNDVSVTVRDRTFLLRRPADLETLWERMGEEDLDGDERIPYWVEVWPASLLLSRWIADNAGRIRGEPCLDLGCGLGLTACMAALCSARVVGMDYEWPALRYAQRNARENGAGKIPLVQMDWRAPGLKAGAFTWIWGADVVYESRFFRPLAELLGHALAPGGRVLFAVPERKASKPFWGHLRERGWRVRFLAEEAVGGGSCHHMQVCLWEVDRGSDRSVPGRIGGPAD